MSVSSTTNRVVYTGNGVTTAFAFPYEFFSTADLVVLSTVISTGVVTTKILTTDYTVSGTPDGSGIYPNGGTVNAVAAPSALVKWTIYRDPTATQTTVFVDNAALPASSLNNGLDKLTILEQRTREIASRSMHLADGDVSGASVVLPTPAASTLLGWASDGLSIINYVVASLSGSLVTAFSSTLLALSDAASWRAALATATTSADNLFTADQSTVSTTAATGTYGPSWNAKRSRATPAANDALGAVTLQGLDTSLATKTFAALRGLAKTVTAAAEDGIAEIWTVLAGTLARRVSVGAGLWMEGATGTDKGAGTINATGLYVNGTALGITKKFISAQQTITSAGSLTIAHGLGVQPVGVAIVLHCVTGENGYTAGQEFDGATANDLTIITDATNLTIRFSSVAGVFVGVPHATTGVTANLTNANWTVIFKAWA